MHTLQLPHSMHSLSQEESGFQSPCVCAHVCGADLQDEDLSIKADLACVLPTDMLVIITWSHCNFKGITSTGT